jgi:hypothetical protein
MLSFTRESTHYFIIANIWIATSILATHKHDVLLAGALGLIWFLYGLWISKKERED